MVEKQVIIKLLNQIEGEEAFKKEAKLVKTLKKENGELTQVYEKQTATELKRITVKSKKNKLDNEEISSNTETLKQGPKFKMHYLGIMFAGMALNRTMSGLTSTAKEWTGASEIMSTAMGVTMLPATMDLLELGILPLSEALLNMPTEMQIAIGYTALGLEGLGKGLEFGGQIALGAGAFKLALPQIWDKIALGLSGQALKGVGKGIGISIALIATIESIKMLAEGIEEGSLKKEVLGILGAGLGVAGAGLLLAGGAGAGIGFVLGVSIALVIAWTLGVQKYSDELKDLGFDDTQIASEVSKTFLPGGQATNMRSRGLEEMFGGGSGELGAISLNPVQTFLNIFGSKTGAPNLLSTNEENPIANSNITVSPVYNISVTDDAKLKKMFQENNTKLTSEVLRLTKV